MADKIFFPLSLRMEHCFESGRCRKGVSEVILEKKKNPLDLYTERRRRKRRDLQLIAISKRK